MERGRPNPLDAFASTPTAIIGKPDTMRSTARIDSKQIDKMDLDITIRMTVEEWRTLMRQMPGQWPSSRIGSHIASVLGHVTRSTEMTFCEPRHEDDDYSGPADNT